MSIPLRVLGDRILVRPDVDANAPELLTSGILVAKTLAAAVTGEDTTTSVQRGTVVAVGTPRHPLKDEADALAGKLVLSSDHWGIGKDESECFLELDAAAMLRDLVRRVPAVAVGDDVLFNHDSGQAITVEGDSFVILHESELLAIVEPEKDLMHV